MTQHALHANRIRTCGSDVVHAHIKSQAYDTIVSWHRPTRETNSNKEHRMHHPRPRKFSSTPSSVVSSQHGDRMAAPPLHMYTSPPFQPREPTSVCPRVVTLAVAQPAPGAPPKLAAPALEPPAAPAVALVGLAPALRHLLPPA